MATSKTFFGKRRGSTKNFTFAVFNGKQVTKEKPEQVKNPRTKAQMVNRMILTTSSAAYAAMKEIVDHSFQGYVYGLQNMSRFQSVNNKLLRANLNADTPQFAYDNYGDAKLLPGAYKVSEGSANSFNLDINQASNSGTDGIVWNIALGTVSQPNTANGVMTAIGLEIGGLATLVGIAETNVQGDFKFFFVRLTAKQGGDVTLDSSNIADYFDIESNVPVTVNFDGNNSLHIIVEVPGYKQNGILCSAFIHSVMVDGVWQRSDETMIVNTPSALSPTAAVALATYPVGGSKILNNGDIDNAYVVENGDSPMP